jgi:hypothetical protein
LTEEENENMRCCTVCCGDFDIEAEGGNEGFIGILPVCFCPTCKTGILEFGDWVAADAFEAGFRAGVEVYSEIVPEEERLNGEIEAAWEAYEEERWE